MYGTSTVGESIKRVFVRIKFANVVFPKRLRLNRVTLRKNAIVLYLNLEGRVQAGASFHVGVA